ncbi:uncharacterized protein LOC126146138 isoform X1 [Schistocerca cancellata]|uniref:uncharacterized protein LOC126146138 isoform X1 n=2 Tax=Schistocerca TaxID=7008 RepID=UPI0021194494|nr:uncharacterized protein LOC126146138 isoform X1 [Schistocerca cancellata]
MLTKWTTHNSSARKMLMQALFVAVLASFCNAQFQPQPAGRILEPPVPTLCAQRKIHEHFNGKGYFFSWKDSQTQTPEDWLGGRNWCRMRCMDLVSLETTAENEFIKKRIVEGNQRYIWTSGRLCDFKGCDRPDLQPLHINGWFWTAELTRLPPTTDRHQNDWSHTGGLNRPQPDNREPQQGGAPENCLAVLNNFYNDGVHWHDVACHHRKPFVCEDNDALLKYVRYTNPHLKV